MLRATELIEKEVELYVSTGQSDLLYSAWPGDFTDRATNGFNCLRGALVRKIRELSAGRSHFALPGVDTEALTRAKVEPMVHGLFPRTEQEAVLRAIQGSVIVLTNTNIEDQLFRPGFNNTAWVLAANLYLASVGAELLA